MIAGDSIEAADAAHLHSQYRSLQATQALTLPGNALRSETPKLNAANVSIQTDDIGDKPTFDADLADQGQGQFRDYCCAVQTASS